MINYYYERKIKNQQGVTLIEVTMASAVAILIIGLAVHLLIISYIEQQKNQQHIQITNNLAYATQTLERSLQRLVYVDKRSTNNHLNNYDQPNENFIVFNAQQIASIKAVAQRYYSNDTQQNSRLVMHSWQPIKTIDCQGRRVAANVYLIESYFVRVSNTDAKRKVLACSALSYTDTSAAKPKNGLKNNGDEIVKDVENFNVLLLIKNTMNNYAYVTLDEYDTKGTIVAVYYSLGIQTQKQKNNDVNQDTNPNKVLRKQVPSHVVTQANIMVLRYE